MNKKEKEFIIPVTWAVFGYIKAKGETLADAVRNAHENLDEYYYPAHHEYEEDSFKIAGLDEYRTARGTYNYKKAADEEYAIYQDGSFEKYAE